MVRTKKCDGDGAKRAGSRQQAADSRQQTADSRQQTADSRQQTADSRQQTGRRTDRQASKQASKQETTEQRIRGDRPRRQWQVMMEMMISGSGSDGFQNWERAPETMDLRQKVQHSAISHK
ncbi:hypothetical protein TWF173_010256 [Orbilia oligospora]|nr:hypothetical protein TWF173_010256 [Orbilia oligospora]